MSVKGVQLRLFFTCWLIFTLHFATDFVREHYLVMTIVDDFSFRLDKYMGLHPDIFETPDHGAHHGANPGASMIAAIPYLFFKPAIDLIVDRSAAANRQPGEAPSAVYKEQRPMRVKFYKQVRERGLDIKFGLVGFVTMAFCMAPLSALGSVVMFRLLAWLGLSAGLSLSLALLYAFGTPIFFRTGYLNQNLMIAQFSLFAFVLLWQQSWDGSGLRIWQRYLLAGFLGGAALLCDYSGAIALLLLGGYGLLRRMDFVPLRPAIKDSLWYVAGAAGPVALLWFYQWQSFGHPFYPGQHYMPPVRWSDLGYRGFVGPSGELFWMLLFEPRFGLFVASPVLLLAFLAPLLSFRKKNIIPLRETMFGLIFFLAFSLFFSCVQYTRLQWVTGIRYIVPAIPFLFLPAVAVLLRMPRLLAYGLAVMAFAESWCMSMVRDQTVNAGVLDSIQKVFLQGFQLPWLNTLYKMATQYAPFLEERGVSPLPLFVLWAALIYGIWRIKLPWQSLEKDYTLQTSAQQVPGLGNDGRLIRSR